MSDAPFTIFPARRVMTMNAGRPTGEAVAVSGDRILGVGSVEELAGWGHHVVDDQFADHVLLPGFIEAHSHVMTGGVWQYTYVGFFDRTDPHGRLWPGCKSIDEVIDRLTQAAEETPAADRGTPLLAWGLDPIYFPGDRLVARHLDRVSDVRPIFVYHASGHLATVNTAMLQASEIHRGNQTPGIARDADGEPNGELQEPPAMVLAGSAFVELAKSIHSDDAKWNYGKEARNNGHTLVTDLGTSQLANPDHVAAWRRVVEDDEYPSRVMVALSSAFGGPSDPELLSSIGVRLRGESTAKLKFGVVKLILDGSIQGFTARVEWPHYFKPPQQHAGDSPHNGLWLIAPEQLVELVSTYHKAGLTVHCHCNGDQASELFIDAVEEALRRNPRWDHRHTVQHCQLTTAAQYRRMRALGMCANIFSNHIFYWGDQHRDITLGPDRAAGMDACGTAARAGVPFSIHSDAPITPLGHLHTAWCAVNRLTSTDQVLGPDERISVAEALAATTISAAYQLHLDHELGSIETGKRADFAVLADDPLAVEPTKLKDIGVWGTVLGGVPQPANS